MNVKRINLILNGSKLTFFVPKEHWPLLQEAFLKKVRNRLKVTDDYLKESVTDSRSVNVDVKSVWYKKQTTTKYSLCCKVMVDGKAKVLMYKALLPPKTAARLRARVADAKTLNLKYWCG